jgi:transcriptional regulator with XRE-family HTH domain
MDSIEFGEYLKGLRKNKGLTLTDLSKQSGVSQPYLSQVEGGKRGIPTPDTLRKLADPLGIPYSDLLIRAGHVNEEEWNHAFVQEGFHGDKDLVAKRVLSNQQTVHQDIKELLENTNSLAYNGWDLMDIDRKQILDMLAIIFPTYSKEKRN